MVNLLELPVDLVLFALSVMMLLCVGLYFRFRVKRARTLLEFIYGGKELSIIPIAFSLVTFKYTTDYINRNTIGGYQLGLQSVYRVIGNLPGILSSLFIFCPVFCRIEAVTVFDYLERRFGTLTSKIGCIYYVVMVILYVSISMHEQCEMIHYLINTSRYTSATVFLLVCVFYFHMGGVKAVVWTNLLQAILMMFALLVLMFTAILDVDNIADLWSHTQEHTGHWKHTVFSVRLSETNIWFSSINLTIMMSFLYGVSAIHYQLISCCSSFAKRKMSLFIAQILDALFAISLLLCSVMMHVSLESCKPFPIELEIRPNEESILPLFIMKHTLGRSGLLGIMLMGLALPSVTSTATAIYTVSCVTFQDLVRPLFSAEMLTDKRKKLMIKLLAQVYGFTILFLTFTIASIRWFIVAISTITEGFVSGQVALFALGMLFQRPNQEGALIGLVFGITFDIVIMVGKIMLFGAYAFPVPPCLIPSDNTEESTNNMFNNSGISVNPEPTSAAKSALLPLFNITTEAANVLTFFIILIVGYSASLLTGPEQYIPPELLSPLYWKLSNYVVGIRSRLNKHEKKLDEDLSLN